jgi:hypothetical protein
MQTSTELEPQHLCSTAVNISSPLGFRVTRRVLGAADHAEASPK